MDRAAVEAMLMRHEGERLKPYVDTASKITIGIGRNLTDVGISQAESGMLFSHDLDTVMADLATFAWWDGLSDARQQALCDLRFNVGAGGFRQFRKMIHALAAKDYATAAAEIRNSQIAPARRAEIAQMVEQG